MLLIGSAAARYHMLWFRNPGDYDIVLNQEELNKFYELNEDRILSLKPQFYKNRYSCEMVDKGEVVKVELHVANSGDSHDLLAKAQKHTHTTSLFGCDMSVASLRTLLAIKKTHITFPIKWQKHIRDYHVFKQHDSHMESFEQNNELLELAYSRILSETQQRFDKYKSSSLDMTNEEFFARSSAYVNRKYEHDDLHRLVMFYDSPMYTKLKKDQSKALCLKSMWDDLSFSDKVKAVKEEAYVIALERKIIPAYERGRDITSSFREDCFSWAIERICTTLTSGWFREFAIENWTFCGPNNESYSFVDKFLTWDRR